MVPLAQKIVAHLPPLNQAEGFGVGPETEDFQQVDLPRHVQVLRQPLEPAPMPIRPEGPIHFRAQPRFDGANRVLNRIVISEGADVFVEVRRARRAATEGMHLRSRQAVEVVELHRAQRRA